MKERVWKTIVCVLLIVTVLSLSVSVFAVDPSPSPSPPNLEDFEQLPPVDVLWGNAGNYMVWLILQSWGIEISVGDVVGYTDAVRDFLDNAVILYLSTLPSPMSVASWIFPWAWESDFWGNFRYNNTMLEDVQDFADWLVQYYGLSDNSITVVDGVQTLSGATLYNMEIWYSAVNQNGEPLASYDAMKFVSGATGWYGYFVYKNTDNYTYQYVFVRNNSGTVANGLYLHTYQNTELNWGYTSFSAGSSTNPSLVFYPIPRQFMVGTDWILPVGTYFEGSNTEFQQFIDTATIQMEGNQKIIVGTINLPDGDITYTPGDSLTIVNNNPVYQEIEWPNTVEISNLPAVVSTGTVSNPQLIEVWRPISSVLEYSADAMAAIIGIMYELPEEVIIPIYAVMGSVIILGVIKLMREH